MNQVQGEFMKLKRKRTLILMLYDASLESPGVDCSILVRIKLLTTEKIMRIPTRTFVDHKIGGIACQRGQNR